MATERFEIIVTSRGTRTVQRDIRGIGQAASATRRTLAFLRSALVVIASARVLRGFLDLADSFTTIRNRLRLLTASTAELNTVQNALFKLSTQTRTAFEDNVTLFSRLTRSTLALRLSFKDLLEITEATALATKVSGAATQEARNAIIQFSQGLAAGALRGDELRSVVEQLPRLADAIGREFGVAGGQLIAFAKANDGALITERIIKALRNEAVTLRQEFQNTTPTIADAFTRLNNSVILFAGGLNDATGIGRLFSSLLITISDNLDLVLTGLLAIAGVVAFNLIISQVAALNGTVLVLARSVVGFARTAVGAFSVVLLPVTLLRTTLLLVGIAANLALTPFVALGRGAIAVVTALINPLQSLVKLFGLLRLAVLANPLFLAGAAIVGTLVAAFFLFEDEIKAVIDRLGGVREIFDVVIAGGIAAVDTIIQAWRRLPAAIADLAIQAANALIEAFESGVNGTVNLLNKIPGIDLEPSNLGRIQNDFEGAAKSIGDVFVSNFNRIREEGGGGIEELKNRFQSLLDTINQATGANFNVAGGFGGFTDELKNQFERFQTFLSSFTGRNLQIDPALLENLPTVPGGATATDLSNLNTLKRKYQSLLASISPLADAFFSLKQAQEAVAAAEKAGIDLAEQFGLTNEEVLRRIERETIGAGNAAANYAEKQKLLKSALDRSIISLDEFNRLSRENRLELLETERTLGAGIERSFLKLQDSVSDVATNIEDAMQTAFGAAEDAVISFVETGKVNIQSLFQDIERQLLRQATRAIVANIGAGLGVGSSPGTGLLGSLFGGKGGTELVGGLSSLFGGGGGASPASQLAAGLIPFQNGGSFTVGAGSSLARLSGVDNRLVAFRARDGERVSVTPKGQRAASPINISFNVQTPDANSFQRSQGQILSTLQTSLNKASRRNN